MSIPINEEEMAIDFTASGEIENQFGDKSVFKFWGRDQKQSPTPSYKWVHSNGL